MVGARLTGGIAPSFSAFFRPSSKRGSSLGDMLQQDALLWVAILVKTNEVMSVSGPRNTIEFVQV